MAIEKYRPSNATEGHGFIGHWCGNCARAETCMIPYRTMAFDVEDPDYPVEWQRASTGPVCTSFVHAGDPIPEPRCPNTLEMFPEPETSPHG